MPSLRRTYAWWDQHLERSGRQKTRDGFKAVCPSHSDQGPSLHVTRKGSDQRPAVVHCFAGCKYDEIETAAREGGRTERAGPKVRKTGKVRVSKGTSLDPIAWLEQYTGVPSEFLNMLDLEARDDRVAFTFPHNGVAKLRRAGTKDFAWNKDGARPPLWPEVPEQVDATIYLAEGETDAIILRYLGLEAYAITKGANSTLSVGVFRALASRGCSQVVLCFDQDEAGDGATLEYSTAILEAGLSVASIAPPVNVLIGESDIRDWYRRTQGDEPLTLTETADLSLDMNSLEAGLPERPPWVWEGYVAQGGVTLIAGPPKVGKSSLLFNLIASQEDGIELLDRACHPGRALMLTEEGGWTILEKKQKYGTESLRVVLQEDVLLRGLSFVNVLHEAVAICKRHSATLLIIDTLAAWAGFEDENDSAEITRALLAIRNIALKAGLAVVLVHHTKKGGGEHGEGVRGSSALFASVDVLVEYLHAGKDRLVTVRSRFLTSPPPVVAGQNPDGTLYVKSTEEQIEEKATPVLEAITDEWQPIADILNATDLSDRYTRDMLRELVRIGKVEEQIGQRGRKEYRLAPDAQDGGTLTRMKVKRVRAPDKAKAVQL